MSNLPHEPEFEQAYNGMFQESPPGNRFTREREKKQETNLVCRAGLHYRKLDSFPEKP